MSNTGLLGRIKSLNVGVKRLLLIIGIVASLSLAPSLVGCDADEYLSFGKQYYNSSTQTSYTDTKPYELWFGALILFCVYWVLIRIVLWVIDGFK